MVDYYLGEIRVMAGLYGGKAPDGWKMCDGSLLQIPEFNALFALLGTTYGGDGRTTFALPDLRSRLPMGKGQGVAGTTQLTNRTLGQNGGAETVALTEATMPAHTHGLNTAGVDATSPTVANNVTFANVTRPNITYLNAGVAGGAQVSPNSSTINDTGANQPHANIMPGMGLYYIIATDGLYPQT